MNKILPFAIVLTLLGCNSKLTKQTPVYQAGFKVVRMADRSRIYKPNTDTTDYLHYRPIDIDIWYPAIASAKDTAMIFRNFLDLFGSRANYYTASKAGDSISYVFAKAFCEGVKCSTQAQLFKFRTASYKDATPSAGKFALVVYMASYNGMGYENYKLFEDLAKKGFVVVSISSIGRYPGDMTMKNEDMLEQVNDAVAAIKHLANSPGIDFSKTAILGYSWGGLSAAILANRIPNVACLISLEGSEFHHYGQDKNEDADFNGIKNSAEFNKMSVAVPYLRFESSPVNEKPGKDSIYNFSEKLSGKRLILKVDSAAHEDFSCLPVVVRQSGNCKTGELYNTVTNLATSFLEEHLNSTPVFEQTLGKKINKHVKEVKR